jgi:hypothetical protein
MGYKLSTSLIVHFLLSLVNEGSLVENHVRCDTKMSPSLCYRRTQKREKSRFYVFP